MRSLLEAGADVNLKDNAEATALMWAAHRGYVEVAELILTTGKVDLNCKNKGGYTALMLAEFNKYPQMVELLKQAGAS
jgi:uncharacterized protein